MPEQVNRTTLMVAVALSAGVHMLAGVTIATLPAPASSASSELGANSAATALTLHTTPTAPLVEKPEPPPAPQPEPVVVKPEPVLPEPPPEREITAGVDDSTAITDTWKGVKPEKAIAHAAPKFDIDQAGYVRQEAAAGQPAEPTPPAAPQPPPEPATEPQPPADQQPQEPVAETSPREAQPGSTEDGQAETTVQGEAELVDHADINLPQQQTQKHEVTPVAPAAQPATPTVQPPAAPTIPPAPTGTNTPPGIVEDDESPARSATETLSVRPGKPVARAGLRIQTSFARYSVSALVLHKPRSPLVRVTFGRDGRVKHAAFVPGQTTGSDDVDKPLLDSLYRWSAKGKDLLTIPADPDAGLTLTFRIVM